MPDYVYDEETTIQYQPHFSRQMLWQQGSILDFAEAAGIEYSEQPGADQSVVVVLPDHTTEVRVTVGCAIPDEVTACEGQPMILLHDGTTAIFLAFANPNFDEE